MATISPAHQTAIVNLYTALFNRAPDASGMTFWAQALADGASLAAITQSFMGTTEGRATYPASQTSSAFIAAFYQTVFGRPAEAGGLAFWTAALDAAGGAGSDAARAAVTGQIISVVATPITSKPAGITDAEYAQTVADRALFGNKVAVGVYFSVTLGSNDVTLARQTLVQVTKDSSSVSTASSFAANGGAVTSPPSPEVPLAPASSLAITKDDLPAAITAKFAGVTGTGATVDATDMDNAQLTAVVAAQAKIAANGITNLVLNQAPLALSDAQVETLLSKATAARFVATDATPDRLALVADRITHLADDGISGTAVLTRSLTDLQLTTLLGAKMRTDASVQLNATSMTTAQLALVGALPEKLDTVGNLSLLDLGDAAITAAVATTLLSKASNASVLVTNAPDANVVVLLAQLSKIADGGITGALSLSAAQFGAAPATDLALKLASTATLAVTGGDGDETINSSAYARPVSVDGGAGSDTLVVSGDAQLGVASTAVFTNIEILHVKGAATAYLSKIASAGQIWIDPSAGAVTLREVSAAQAQSLSIWGGASAITIGLADTSGTNDIAKAVVLTSLSAIDLSEISLAGVERLELISNVSGGGRVTLSTAQATSLNSIKLDNIDGAVTLGVAAAHTAANLVIDASGSGATTISAAAYTLSSGVTIRGGVSGGTLTGSLQGDTITGGQGNDLIVGDGVYAAGTGFVGTVAAAAADVLTGGAGNDTFAFRKNSSTLTALDRITDLDLGAANSGGGVDKLVFQFQGPPFAATVIQLIPTQEEQLNTAAAAAGSITPAVTALLGGQANSAGEVVMFTLSFFNNRKFILFNGDGNASFDAGADYLIEVTGVSGALDASDILLVA